MKKYAHPETCTQMFIVALVIIVKRRKLQKASKGKGFVEVGSTIKSQIPVLSVPFTNTQTRSSD